jgi:hypothetical protein
MREKASVNAESVPLDGDDSATKTLTHSNINRRPNIPELGITTIQQRSTGASKRV